MFNLGPQEMIAFGIIAILLFGSKLPEVARKLGGSYREFRKSIGDFQREFQNWDRDPPPKPVQRTYEEQSPSSSITSTPKFTPPPSENE
jgi:sec-independent protein translocase protein TatA